MTKVVSCSLQDADNALAGIGLQQRQTAITEARANDLSPDDLVDFALVVKHDHRLSAGAVLSRIRNGCWPVDDVDDAETIRAWLAGSSLRQQRDRKQRTEMIRSSVVRAVRKRLGKPFSSVELAETATALQDDGLGEFATNAEHAAAVELNSSNANCGQTQSATTWRDCNSPNRHANLTIATASGCSRQPVPMTGPPLAFSLIHGFN